MTLKSIVSMAVMVLKEGRTVLYDIVSTRGLPGYLNGLERGTHRNLLVLKVVMALKEDEAVLYHTVNNKT